MLEVKWSGEIRFKDNLKVYVEMAEDHSVIKAVWIDEFGNEYPLGTVPAVTDLGNIDPEAYDWDIYLFLNTLTQPGEYRFTFDDFSYYVSVQSTTQDGSIFVSQIYWGSEEGGSVLILRSFQVQEGEIINESNDSLLTYDMALNLFASKTHVHYIVASGAQSIWQYCNTMPNVNGQNVIYYDTSNLTSWLIEPCSSNRAPIKRIQRVTELADPTRIYQRSATYSSGANAWGPWYEFRAYLETMSVPTQAQGQVITVNQVPNASYTDYSVTFPKEYDSIPIVVAGLAGTITVAGMANVSVAAYGVTKTGFTARIYNSSGGSRNITFRYIAIQA